MLSARLAQLRFERNLFPPKYFQSQSKIRLSSTWPNVDRDYGKKDREAFKETYPEVKKCFIDIVRKYDNTILPEWMEKCADYNLPYTALARGQIVVLAYKLLAPDTQLDPQSIKFAQYIGWCVELQEIAAIISDDQIDKAKMRNGRLAWHKVDGVGNQLTNDTFVLNYASFACLEKLIGHKEYYCRLARRFRDAVLSMYLGQSLDILNARSCITSFTMEKYINIIKHKAGEYGYYLPVAMALDMCGFIDQTVYDEAFRVLIEIGKHTQIRDDYYDCFGKPVLLGNDIEENRLTWLAVKAVELADKAQSEVLKSCYGQKDPEKVEKVRDVYKDLRLNLMQEEYEKNYYDNVMQMINNSSHDGMKLVYKSILDKLYKHDRIGV